MIDIALRIISKEGLKNVGTNVEVFERLIEKKILPVEFKVLAPKIVSVRNRLVHEYDEIDDEIIFGIIKKHLPRFVDFYQAIEKYLEKEV